ncbi:MAG: hypothetical protein HY606_05750 [Planctomycetes bacterium]|nr:hypothetical protein [Planctomycetota bacterium]
MESNGNRRHLIETVRISRFTVYSSPTTSHRSKFSAVSSIVLSSLLLCSCAAVQDYGADRVNDLFDIFRLEGKAGYGVSFGAKAGEIIHLGAGSNLSSAFGWGYGEVYAIENRETHYIPVSPFIYTNSGPYLHKDIADGYSEATHKCACLLPFTTTNKARPSLLHSFDIEAEIFAGILGIRAGFSLGEFTDFILGLFTIDIAGDDNYDGRRDKIIESIIKPDAEIKKKDKNEEKKH